MPKKEKQKKSRKEGQRERQRAEEAERIRQEVERRYEKGRKGLPSGKVWGAICLVFLIVGAYGVWQYTRPPTVSEEPPPVNPTPGEPSQTPQASDFTLRDINGSSFSLSQQAGKVIAIHFMGVSCGGGIVQTNENQLRSLKSVCSSYCGEKSVTIVTVAATTCATSCLEKIRSDYGVTWTLGNDYDDGTGDIISAYSSYSIDDGTIVLINKGFQVVNVYAEEATFETLSSRISQLL